MTQTLTIECAAGAVPVRVLRRANARRLRLVADPVRREFRLTLPPRATLGTARAFLDDHHGWIAERAQPSRADALRARLRDPLPG
ncbi:hypothetical protein E6W36_02545 [Hankyongella ginsenosidimutans]|uniref:DUF45 domain-containing protein n=1 Tax=Hankyongella ginsenosidimutans TaxID=1763828 RepID=A0A4D7BTJ1_9SPHN|nr:hypothetical protein [Hankyongella ginsenosidimutans]QCI78889.1 hypothetical protein E6W36_02545 [Hankyongella ginsenosidimutans]